MSNLALRKIEGLGEAAGSDSDLAKQDSRPGTIEVFDGEVITREQRRSRRKRVVRAKTISVKRMTKRELAIGRALFPETDHWRPRTRGECTDGPRPCPFVSCKYHLYLDVKPSTGAIKLNFPDLEVWEMTESCALDVADRGGTTLEDVGAILNLTRERIRQVEVKALAKIEAARDMEALREYVDEGPVGRRCLPKLSDDELEGVRGKAPKPSKRAVEEVACADDEEDEMDEDERVVPDLDDLAPSDSELSELDGL